MSAKLGTLAGMMFATSMRMKYQSRMMDLFSIPPISTRIRKMTATKRKKEVRRAQILRVRVARLTWAFERSGAGGGAVSEEAVVEVRRRVKRPMVDVCLTDILCVQYVVCLPPKGAQDTLARRTYVDMYPNDGNRHSKNANVSHGTVTIYQKRNKSKTQRKPALRPKAPPRLRNARPSELSMFLWGRSPFWL